ncbi:MAG: dihydrofolate reductase family protein [Verrucomicrobiales bacterium]|nr:dihydrofolate reductase family protein [Verrucomicrobiales bacterium]
MKRKIILNLCTTLDSYIEGPNGEYDWCFTDQDYGMTEFLSRVDTIFFGRKSYEQLKSSAPDAFADKRAIVFSRTLKDGENGLKVIGEDLEKEVSELLIQPGKDIWLFGGASLVSTLLKMKVVDELMIAVHPLILGKGKPLFTGVDERIHLKLTDTKTYSSGLVQMFYEVNYQ